VTNNSPLTDTGVICQQEMVATFCDVVRSPNSAGYGSNGSAAATSAGIATPSPAIPACGEGHRQRQRAMQLRPAPPVVALVADLRRRAYTPPGGTPPLERSLALSASSS
jgi:hypothetical protein